MSQKPQPWTATSRRNRTNRIRTAFNWLRAEINQLHETNSGNTTHLQSLADLRYLVRLARKAGPYRAKDSQ
jgi:hypothetical protein